MSVIPVELKSRYIPIVSKRLIETCPPLWVEANSNHQKTDALSCFDRIATWTVQVLRVKGGNKELLDNLETLDAITSESYVMSINDYFKRVIQPNKDYLICVYGVLTDGDLIIHDADKDTDMTPLFMLWNITTHSQSRWMLILPPWNVLDFSANILDHLYASMETLEIYLRKKLNRMRRHKLQLGHLNATIQTLLSRDVENIPSWIDGLNLQVNHWFLPLSNNTVLPEHENIEVLKTLKPPLLRLSSDKFGRPQWEAYIMTTGSGAFYNTEIKDLEDELIEDAKEATQRKVGYDFDLKLTATGKVQRYKGYEQYAYVYNEGGRTSDKNKSEAKKYPGFKFREFRVTKVGKLGKGTKLINERLANIESCQMELITEENMHMFMGGKNIYSQGTGLGQHRDSLDVFTGNVNSVRLLNDAPLAFVFPSCKQGMNSNFACLVPLKRGDFCTLPAIRTLPCQTLQHGVAKMTMTAWTGFKCVRKLRSSAIVTAELGSEV